MREHQIVITLKPEQFAQIQQMSKAAGAKTMGIFVRKALLAALEIEGVKPNLGSLTKSAGDTSLLDDLQRLRGQLQELIAQSLLSVQEESFDPIADLLVEREDAEDELEDELDEDQFEEPEENPLSKEEPIVSSIKVRDPLDDLLDERLKTRLETYLEHQRKGKPKAPTTRREPEPEPNSQSISDLDKTPKKVEENTPKPKPTAPRSIPPDQLPRKDETGFSGKSIPLSGNPPPKKPKY